MAFPKVGNLAPAFTLLDQDGNKVSLKDFKGKSNVVLYFYPKAMTPGCTVQACGIRDSKAAFKKAKTVVLGVSPDPVARLGRFIDKQQLNFTLLSDEDHAITEKYGYWDLK
jgi:peroxiredoxin Q/BCP